MTSWYVHERGASGSFCASEACTPAPSSDAQDAGSLSSQTNDPASASSSIQNGMNWHRLLTITTFMVVFVVSITPRMMALDVCEANDGWCGW